MDFTNLVGLLPQIGSTGAVIVVVVVFLNHIQKDSVDRKETHLLCEEKLERITNKCLEAFSDNTKAVTELRDAVRGLQRVA